MTGSFCRWESWDSSGFEFEGVVVGVIRGEIIILLQFEFCSSL